MYKVLGVVSAISNSSVIATLRFEGAARLPIARPAAATPDPAANSGRSPESQPAARAGLSLTALDKNTQTAAQESSDGADKGETDTQAGQSEKTNAQGEKINAEGLTEAEQREVEKLKERDREVRQHERAHAAAGGQHAGQPTYKFVTGPDGKQYAVSGEVKIDTSPVPNNPEATIRKLEQVKRAALAPAEPSSQDRRVAAQADAAIIKARQELAEERREELADNIGSRGEQSPAAGVPGSASAGETGFDPEERFRTEIGGVGEVQGTGLPGPGSLKANVGLLDPGTLFNLIA